MQTGHDVGSRSSSDLEFYPRLLTIFGVPSQWSPQRPSNVSQAENASLRVSSVQNAGRTTSTFTFAITMAFCHFAQGDKCSGRLQAPQRLNTVPARPEKLPGTIGVPHAEPALRYHPLDGERMACIVPISRRICQRGRMTPFDHLQDAPCGPWHARFWRFIGAASFPPSAVNQFQLVSWLLRVLGKPSLGEPTRQDANCACKVKVSLPCLIGGREDGACIVCPRPGQPKCFASREKSLSIPGCEIRIVLVMVKIRMDEYGLPRAISLRSKK